MRKLAAPIAAAIAAVLTGCGGGGSSAPAAPASNTTAPIQVSTGGSGVPVTMSFNITRDGASATRSVQSITVPATVSNCIQSASNGVCGLTVQAYPAGTTPATPTAPCSTTPTAGGCVADLFANGTTVTATIIVPVGSDTFVVSLYGQEPTLSSGVYTVLGTASATAKTTTTISLNATNVVNLAFAGPGAPAQTLPSASLPSGGSVSGTVNLKVPAGACPSSCGVGAATVSLTIALGAARSPQTTTGPPQHARLPQMMLPSSCPPSSGVTAATSGSIFVMGINLALEGGAFYNPIDNPGATSGLYASGLAIAASLSVTPGSSLDSALGSSGTFNVAYQLPSPVNGSNYQDTGTVAYAYSGGNLTITDTGSAGATCSGTYIVYLNQTLGIPVIF